MNDSSADPWLIWLACVLAASDLVLYLTHI